jgi:monoamine oxidase
VSSTATDPAQPLVVKPVPAEVLRVPGEGLERREGDRRRVLVVGGGLAGLVAAYELERQGHDPVVLEAQNRVGGRIHTLRSFAPGLYAEAGGMRIPQAHDLTLAYCAKFDLALRPFVMGNPKGLVYVGGRRVTAGEAAADPDSLGFPVAENERGRSCGDLWAEAIAPLRTTLETEGTAAGWETIVAKYDSYSLEEFLQEQGWSAGAIEMYGVLEFVESDLQNAFLETLREDLGGAYVDMHEIVGGMDLLPNAFCSALAGRIRFGAEVQAIEQDDSSATVRYRTAAGRFSLTGDYAICTLPFGCLRQVEARFSHEKQKAIRELNYSASTKVVLQVRNRRWETEDEIAGGASCTDLSIRRLNYPTPDPSTTRGVLLASYTWGQDALRWGSLDEESRLEQALEDVGQIHPWIREEFECGASHAWYSDPWAGGAFALFDPGQQSSLQPAVVAPEGRVLFAGEHCSLYHAWIQGALESGIRAAREIHEAA